MKGLKRLFASSKGWAMMVALTNLTLINLVGMDPDVARTLSIAVITLSGLYIVGTAYEDGKKGHQTRYSFDYFKDDDTTKTVATKQGGKNETA